MLYDCWIVIVVREALSLSIKCVNFLVVLWVKWLYWEIADGRIADAVNLHIAQHLIVDVGIRETVLLLFESMVDLDEEVAIGQEHYCD